MIKEADSNNDGEVNLSIYISDRLPWIHSHDGQTKIVNIVNTNYKVHLISVLNLLFTQESC